MRRSVDVVSTLRVLIYAIQNMQLQCLHYVCKNKDQRHLDYTQHPLQLCRLHTLGLYALQAFGICHRCLLKNVLLSMGRTAVDQGK